MDERRDLVDREELRRRIKANESTYDAWSYRNAMHLLDAMPAVECPRGWTRDEVLAELDAAEQRGDEAVVKWLLTGDGKWVEVGRTWVGDWRNPDVPRANVRVEVVERAPEWVPLTQLVGHTIDGCDEAVTSPPVWTVIEGEAEWRWHTSSRSTWLPFPEGTLNLETGQVAVRPKAAT